MFVIQAGFYFVESFYLARVGQRVVADLRIDLHSRLLSLPAFFFDNRRVGEMVSRVTNDVTLVQTVLTETPVAFLRQAVTFVGALALMLYLNWQLTLFILAILPPITFFAIYFGRRIERVSTDVQDRLADSTTVLEESLSGIRVIKSFGRQAYEQERFSATSGTHLCHGHAAYPPARHLYSLNYILLAQRHHCRALVWRPAGAGRYDHSRRTDRLPLLHVHGGRTGRRVCRALLAAA